MKISEKQSYVYQVLRVEKQNHSENELHLFLTSSLHFDYFS